MGYDNGKQKKETKQRKKGEEMEEKKQKILLFLKWETFKIGKRPKSRRKERHKQCKKEKS